MKYFILIPWHLNNPVLLCVTKMQMVTEFARGRPYLAFMLSGGDDPPPAPKRTFPVKALPLRGSWRDSLTPADLNCSFNLMCCTEVMQWSSLDKQLGCVRSYSSLFILILSHTWLLCSDCAGNLNFFGMCYRPSYRGKKHLETSCPISGFPVVNPAVREVIPLELLAALLSGFQSCTVPWRVWRLLVYCRLETGEYEFQKPSLSLVLTGGGGVVIWELRPKTLFCELERGLHLVVFVSLLFTLINNKAPLLRPKTFLSPWHSHL